MVCVEVVSSVLLFFKKLQMIIVFFLFVIVCTDFQAYELSEIFRPLDFLN